MCCNNANVNNGLLNAGNMHFIPATGAETAFLVGPLKKNFNIPLCFYGNPMAKKGFHLLPCMAGFRQMPAAVGIATGPATYFTHIAFKRLNVGFGWWLEQNPFLPKYSIRRAGPWHGLWTMA